MPKAYERMRNAFIRDGLSEDAAQAKAAAIYNSTHKDNPVGEHHKSKPARRKHRNRAKR